MAPPHNSRSRAHVIDVLVDHGTPVSFETLCDRVLTPETRFLVLDLDRTVHLGLNMGEMLGWELCALQAYGPEGLDENEARRRGRFLLDRSRPAGLLWYLAKGLQVWTWPGLYYLLWGKLAFRSPWLRRQTYQRFGAEPVRAVQRVPQLALMRHLAETDLETTRELARRVWRRHRGVQVVTREGLDHARSIAPHVEIVLTSASPQPMVEVAAEELGVDLIGYSTPERINSGSAKIEHLEAMRPDIWDVEVVGMSDTGYCEDHCWTRSFSVVVDVNSTTPFPVVVEAGSSVREVHSARILTLAEREARAAGDPDYLDPKRGQVRMGSLARLGGADLKDGLAAILAELERLGAEVESTAGRTAYFRAQLLERARRAADELLPTAAPR
jgi:hypothetical protein